MKATWSDLEARVRDAIDRDEPWCVEVADEHLQMYDNVKRTSTFRDWCADHLLATTKRYAHLRRPPGQKPTERNAAWTTT